MEEKTKIRIEELEEEIMQMQMHMAHQESLLQNLNEVLIEQQSELESLRKEQKSLYKSIQAMFSEQAPLTK